ncbi:MAG: DUF2249 domain-containing protein [Oscillospiraceae bacterium]
MPDPFLELDVRPILIAGGEPFGEIMAAVDRLAPGQGLRLLASFRPVPLFAVLAKKGFSHAEREIGGGDWEVLFSPGGEAAAPAPAPAAADGSAWPAPVAALDARDLDPPEPMQKVMAALESARPGEVVSALLCRKPPILIPELEALGHEWHGDFEDGGESYRIFIRKRAG